MQTRLCLGYRVRRPSVPLIRRTWCSAKGPEPIRPSEGEPSSSVLILGEPPETINHTPLLHNSLATQNATQDKRYSTLQYFTLAHLSPKKRNEKEKKNATILKPNVCYASALQQLLLSIFAYPFRFLFFFPLYYMYLEYSDCANFSLAA